MPSTLLSLFFLLRTTPRQLTFLFLFSPISPAPFMAAQSKGPDQPLSPEDLRQLMEQKDLTAIRALGGVEAIAESLGVDPERGLERDPVDLARRQERSGLLPLVMLLQWGTP